MSHRPGDMLITLCSSAQSIVIAAPYIKADALTTILTNVSPAASLVCITRWNPQDIAAGASDTACRNIVADRGGSFMLHPALHAKYYRIDDVALIGSANLTYSAMGWSSQSNLEILCRAGDDFDALAFQKRLFEESREIGDTEFASWEAITTIMTHNPIANTYDLPTLDPWRPTARNPKNLEIVYQGRVDEIASYDEQQAAQRDIQALRVPPGLTNDQVRTWVSACLLAAPFTNRVIRLLGIDTLGASRILSEAYSLSTTEARRSMETVQNWLAFLAPETLHHKS